MERAEIKLYNSLSQQLETFIPLNPSKVVMYFCGPTVYSYPHLGNGRAAIFADLVYRVFKANGYQVEYLSNFTDVDDKIVLNALKNNQSIKEYSQFYITQYLASMKMIGATNVNKYVKVSDYIEKIVAFIQQLIAQDFAYEVNGNVYFRVDKLDSYLKLSGNKLADLEVGARIEENKEKENPHDFALWKKTEGENYPSPFSKGRPGWHSECVVMIKDSYDKIDIHGGGADLKFPHHDNEIAQSNALYHDDIANYWLHNAMLKIDDQKMSKSQGNVVTIQDAVNTYGSNLVRYFLITNNYQNSLNLTATVLESLTVELSKIEETYRKLQLSILLNNLTQEVELDYYQEFLKQLNHNFNIQNAMTVLFKLIKDSNQKLRIKDPSLISYLNQFNLINQILGLNLEIVDVSLEDIELYNNWLKAKAEANYQLADSIRQSLVEKKLI